MSTKEARTTAEKAELPELPARPRPDGDRPRERSCLSCGSKFQSEGWHNRLCPSCRKRSDPTL